MKRMPYFMVILVVQISFIWMDNSQKYTLVKTIICWYSSYGDIFFNC